MNVVITGTTQGIGLELTKIALENNHHVLAVARSRENSRELEVLSKKYTTLLEIHFLDLTKQSAPEELAKVAGRSGQVDLLINNAGVYKKGETRTDFEESFLVNTITPFLLTKALLPSLKKSPVPKAVHISSLMGSVADNTSGSSHAYRSSKAALNMIMKGLSIDEPWLATMCLHPGWVQTRMGTEAAPVKPADSASGLWNVISDLTLKSTGSFMDYQGNKLHW